MVPWILKQAKDMKGEAQDAIALRTATPRSARR
jgi:hypothetical protein